MGLRGEVRTNKAIKYIILRRTAGWSTRAFQSALPSQILPRPFRRGTRHAGLNTKLLLKRGSAYAFRREFLSRCFAARLFHLSFLSSPALFFPSFLPSFHVRSFVRSYPGRSHTARFLRSPISSPCKPPATAFAWLVFAFLSARSDLRGKSDDVLVCRARPGNTSESCPRFETRTRYDKYGGKVRQARSNPIEIF